MGFLKAGTPLRFQDSLPYIKYVREHGIIQFLNLWRRVKERQGDELKWGDEIEYHLIQLDSESKTSGIALIAHEFLQELHALDKEIAREGDSWHPEYGNWMVEGTPGFPYGDDTTALLGVEANMAERRAYIRRALPENVELFSLVAPPRMGCGNDTRPPSAPGGDVSTSSYISDDVISKHPRFPNLTRNIRLRRGEKVHLRIPIFRDSETVINESKERADPSDDTDGFVHFDAMGFGMGCCCLQITFQARNIQESRRLYDQLAILSPLVMALTAATPILKGKLTDRDVRWELISAMVDCRTPAERGEEGEAEWQKCELSKQAAGGGGRVRIHKSRYASIDSYLSNHAMNKAKYDDIELVIDEPTKATLLEAGVDERLANHIAHLWCRDPLSIFKEYVEVDDSKTMEHFENIQSTNWQNVRWKPPPPDVEMGWRVELRTMEAQITDFENAAFAVFTALINRVILFFDLNMYMPLSLVDKNMETAHHRNAAVDGKFYFRKFVKPLPETCPADFGEEDPDAVEEMTLSEIFLGKGSHFPGFIPLILTYLDIIGVSEEVKAKVSHYLRFIELRTTGELLTPATWMRKFVRSHPSYKNDSVVSEDIAYDLLQEVSAIASGKKQCVDMFGTTFGVPRKSEAGEATASPKGHRRMRGGSFAREASTSECVIIHQLVERYAATTSWEDTPAFLSHMTPAADLKLAAVLGVDADDDTESSTPEAGAGSGAGAED